MASNLSVSLHRIADYFGLDRHAAAIAWTILVVIGVTILIVVVSREDPKQRRDTRTD